MQQTTLTAVTSGRKDWGTRQGLGIFCIFIIIIIIIIMYYIYIVSRDCHKKLL